MIPASYDIIIIAKSENQERALWEQSRRAFSIP
nr:MAG TPA: hypothetical protein [Caudoviricetes sp.]